MKARLRESWSVAISPRFASALADRVKLVLDLPLLLGDLFHRPHVLHLDPRHQLAHVDRLQLWHPMPVRVIRRKATLAVDTFLGAQRLFKRHHSQLVRQTSLFLQRQDPCTRRAGNQRVSVVQVRVGKCAPAVAGEHLASELLGSRELQPSLRSAAFRARNRCTCLRRLARCESIFLLDFEEELGLTLNVIFDLQLVQVEYHVLQHVDRLILGLAQEVGRSLVHFIHLVHHIWVAGGPRRHHFLKLRRDVDQAELRD